MGKKVVGWCVGEIMEGKGKKVMKRKMVKEGGMEMCKCMVGWVKWGNGESGESWGKKGEEVMGE